ncbi:hypothetical protein DMH12_15505 [Streptomyces sp. WAC 04229]|uniref:hypothetical protein n=1 Tax=Streptomyces sp. WAC 04229 TaxID=2203206 RepID=UPI000F736913|nr:hypothetical protein [Streptomyces sp. WAC 04229]RSN55621.1 hypothetical protein DMH12_15505 [Streptomyces sp. WAC 04229]
MALTASVQAWLLSQLGPATSVADLEGRYTRLGAARAVALEVLNERLAALLQQPTTVNVSGVVAVGFAENIKALERKIALLESGQPPAPDDPEGPGGHGELGVFRLVERPRR